MSRLVFFAFLLLSLRDWLCRKLFCACIKYSSHGREPRRRYSFVQICRVIMFQYLLCVDIPLISFSPAQSHIGFHEPSQVFSAELLWSRVHPAAAHFINVENCKLNLESPNFRFVSCFSNVHIKGQKMCKWWTLKWGKRALSNMPLRSSRGLTLKFTGKKTCREGKKK